MVRSPKGVRCLLLRWTMFFWNNIMSTRPSAELSVGHMYV